MVKKQLDVCSINKTLCTVKPAHVVASIKGLPVLPDEPV